MIDPTAAPHAGEVGYLTIAVVFHRPLATSRSVWLTRTSIVVGRHRRDRGSHKEHGGESG